MMKLPAGSRPPSSLPPAVSGLSSSPLGIVFAMPKPQRPRGPPCGPMRSAAKARMKCQSREVCSFQSASSWTRPCCMSTRVKCLRGSKVSREKSPFIVASLGRKDDARVDSGGRELVEARAQVRLALRLEEVVVDAHLRLVVGPAPNLFGAGLGELAVGGRAVAHAVEDGADAHLRALALGPRLGVVAREGR